VFLNPFAKLLSFVFFADSWFAIRCWNVARRKSQAVLVSGQTVMLTLPDFCSAMTPEMLTKAKSLGFSDRQIANLIGTTEDEVRALRKQLGIVPSYRLVDTCAAEFEAYTPYY
jgi:hypothetical protein